MKPIKFKEANKNLQKPSNMTDKECSSLWVFTDNKQCVSCWKLSFTDRLKALVFGKIWIGILTGTTQPPIWADCKKTVFTYDNIYIW